MLYVHYILDLKKETVDGNIAHIVSLITQIYLDVGF